MHAASWWITTQLGFSTTTSQRAFRFRRASRWGITGACGTRTAGRRKAGGWRRTGRRPRSRRRTGITTRWGAWWVAAAATPATGIWAGSHGWRRCWMRMDGTGFGGSNRTTWFTTTATILIGLVGKPGFPRNARCRGFRRGGFDSDLPGPPLMKVMMIQISDFNWDICTK